MTTTTEQDMGLYSPEVATYHDLSLLIDTSSIEENPGGSALAASLLQLPDVFTHGTAAVILDSVAFDIHSSEREIQAGGSLKPAREILAERFAAMADIDAEEQIMPAVDTSILEQVLAFATEDVEVARDFYQATADLREHDQRNLGAVEKVRLLLDELKEASTEVTEGQLQLVADFDTAAVAARSFPAAQRLLESLTEEQDLTPAEARKQDRTSRAQRERVAAAGNLQLGESTDLEIMQLLEEDPEAIASVALNSASVTADNMLDILENSSNQMIFNWMFGLERQSPQPLAIEQLMARFTDDRIRELAVTCCEQIAVMDAKGGDTPSVPWIVDIIRHVYVPRVYLDAPTAALVWHELSDVCEDDPSMWLAVLLADTTETPTRLQDIV